MLDKEPMWYPSRSHSMFPYSPGVPDRQLWAIGMVVVQWGMTEFIIEQQIDDLIGNDAALKDEYRKIRNFKQSLDFWQRLAEAKLADPLRPQTASLIKRIKNVRDQRDKIVHKIWGGGMQEGTWANPEGHPTTDAALLRDKNEPYKGKSQDARNTLSWRLTFGGIRKIAMEIATLNRDLLQTFLLPPSDGSAPHSNVNV
jgi:hypothetical protein